MNLHAIVSGAVRTINPSTFLTIRPSTGYITNPDYSRTPTYTLMQIEADVQGLDQAGIRMMESLNIQGISRRVWVNGQFAGLVRAASKGGDLVTTPDGNTWLITAVPEGWDTSGWCSFIMTMQDGA